MTTMENREQSCAARIDAHREGRESDLRTLFAITDGPEGSGEYDGDTLDVEGAQERLYEYPLAVSTFVTLRIDLSTGGPADYLTAKLGRERYGWAVESVSYHFADWYDHAEENVPDTSPLWRLAEFYAESLDPSASVS